jgi:hypothetical protein
VNRADWQRVAEEKLAAAGALLAASQWASAYYLAGYAIECGLKSCILARLAGFPEVIFEVKTYSEKCWSHDVSALVELARLKGDLDAARAVAPALTLHWETVCEWSEVTRYECRTQAEAEKLYKAITDAASGVMQWIKTYW